MTFSCACGCVCLGVGSIVAAHVDARGCRHPHARHREGYRDLQPHVPKVFHARQVRRMLCSLRLYVRTPSTSTAHSQKHAGCVSSHIDAGACRQLDLLASLSESLRVSCFSLVRSPPSSSPTLFNAGTPTPQMSSCFLVHMKEDSIEGIFDTLKTCAQISKSAGGIGAAPTLTTQLPCVLLHAQRLAACGPPRLC